MRAPDCGDGYACDKDGLCRGATGQTGDLCKSEVECVAGLACQIDDTATDAHGELVSSCVAENAARPAGAACLSHGDCRNGTCDFGRCVDLCTDTRDCGWGTSCTQLPHIDAGGHLYRGCLQSGGALAWQIPIKGPSAEVLLPIPSSARGLSVFFSVDDHTQKVGATKLTSPSGVELLDPFFTYYSNPYVRHRPELGQSVLALPASPAHPLEPGVYRVAVSSQRASGNPSLPSLGTATPRMTAVVKLGTSSLLDLHFHFLNLDDHPCAAMFGGKLDASTVGKKDPAPPAFFAEDFLGTLRSILANGEVGIGTISYQDLRDHPDLDGLDQQNLASLLELGSHTVGVNVFFVRTLSPVGLQAIGPNPGPAGLAGTRQSGIVIGLDTLCYRSWTDIARITARELARYMGLYNNIEPDAALPDTIHGDPISDSGMSNANLMFYSELGGDELSPGQKFVLTRSPVLR